MERKFFCNYYGFSVTKPDCECCDKVHACDQSIHSWLASRDINQLALGGFKIGLNSMTKDQLLDLLYAYESYVTCSLQDRRIECDPIDITRFIRCNKLNFAQTSDET